MSDSNFSTMRAAMVASQLRTNAVTDPLVIDAFASVQRDRFVPKERCRLAYTDMPVMLTPTRSLNPPLTTARLICEAGIKPGDKVLLVGAASGYTAAILAKLCAEVVALEQDVALIAMAAPLLAHLPSVQSVEGELTSGWARCAPYDVIIIDGAIEVLPKALIEQCKDGGRVVCALLQKGITRLSIGYKTGGSMPMIGFFDGQSVILPGFAAARAFQF